MNNIDHILVLLAALIVQLGFYLALVVTEHQKPQFLEATIVATIGGIATLARQR